MWCAPPQAPTANSATKSARRASNVPMSARLTALCHHAAGFDDPKRLTPEAEARDLVGWKEARFARIVTALGFAADPDRCVVDQHVVRPRRLIRYGGPPSHQAIDHIDEANRLCRASSLFLEFA